MTRLLVRALLAAACMTPATATSAAAQPLPSVLDLFNALPQPPATADAAGAWFDAGGILVHGPLVELKGRIARLTTSLESRRAALARHDVAQGQRAVADVGQGLANAGIDIARMQSDPAYAAQMQATLKSMTPQQLMALSMTMTAPMNADAALVDQSRVEWQNRSHFFGIAATAMRRILVDHARARQADKRGGGIEHAEINDEIIGSDERGDELIAVDEALARLAAWDPVKSRVIELRFFGGLSIEECAEVMEVSVATVNRHWRMAKAWLHGELTRATSN